MEQNDRRERSVYIAGPMTGYVMHNFPAFEAARCELRLRGFHAMYSGQDVKDFTHPWEYYMRIALSMLVKCNCIALLPGWEHSRGATMEHNIAMMLNMEVIELNFCYQGAKENAQSSGT